MRTLLAVIVFVVLFTGAYLVLSFVEDREPVRLRREILELSHRLQQVEESLKSEALTKQAAVTSEVTWDASRIQRNTFIAAMASIRVHILKVKIDLMLKNTANAESELGIIDEALEMVKALATDEDKKSIVELQSTLRKVMTQIDTDLPAAVSNVDILWHQLSNKLMRSQVRGSAFGMP